ncbi:DHS-like NAD/FAD-binding domain-containing protein [Cristinia sonorae]|uniref:DHS-like NAD/FAD-binding domain-containing protein n=1 Tax=Cristinia sonorae TaxID=1940300 RepID=A0A8K0ULC6_9AGAR|nr:DHS-like NAD/FAD-binding domain-containing protein [Cristinia sonorae]
MIETLNISAADASTRRALVQLSQAVAKCKKIVVVTGAGISCSSGIPDFRSSDGLYNLVKQQHPDVVMKGRDLFDASLFRDPTSTAVFYTFISQLKQSIDQAAPSATHRFIKTLDSKHKLLRSYTQNIDGLEERAGLLGSSCHEARTNGKGKAKLRVKDVRNVQLHGDIHRVRCTFCSADFPCTKEHLDEFDRGVAPPCPECSSRSEARVARSARRLTIGTLRPAIVLYDEPHPLGDDIGIIHSADITRKPDMLIIMGTSLKVHGLKKLVKDFAKAVHEAGSSSSSAGSSSTSLTQPSKPKQWSGKVIFVNKTAPGGEWDGVIDYHVAGETDKWVEKVLEEWRSIKPSDFETQTTLDDAVFHDDSTAFKIVKEVTNTVMNKGAAGGNAETAVKRGRQLVEESPAVVRSLAEPVSPSKRRKGENHYSDGESSPAKKHATQSKENGQLEPSERGLLFGADSKKAKAKDDLDLGPVGGKVAAEKKRGQPRSKSVPKVKTVRLVVGADPRPARRTARR